MSSRRHRPSSVRRSSVALVLWAVLILVTGAIAGPAWSSDAGPSDGEIFDGKPFDAKLEDLDGDRQRLEEMRGAPLLLELWATWCVPCRAQTQVLVDLAPELEAAGVTVVAVNEGEEADVVRAFLEGQPSAHLVLLDRYQEVPTQLEIVKIPALVLLRADGTVAGQVQGLARREGVLELLAQLPAADPETD